MIRQPRPGPRDDFGAVEVDLSKAIQIPPHPPITLQIEGVRRWPASCRINILAIRQFNDNTLDFHCSVNPGDFKENRSFLPEGDGDRSGIMRFFLGCWQIEQIVNRRNEYINLKEMDTQTAVTDMVSVLPKDVQRAVEKFFENLRGKREIDDVRSDASRAIGEVSSSARRLEKCISMRAPGRPSLVLNDRGNEISIEAKKVRLGERHVECIKLKSAVIFRSGKDELGDEAIDQCEDFGGVVLGPTGEVIRVVGGDGVSATQAPASTARLAVAAALTHSGSPKESIVAADACVQGSYEVAALIRELDSMGIPPNGARYRSRRKALDGSGGQGRIGATTLLVASVEGNQLNIARLGDMGAGVVTSSGEIFMEAEEAQTVPNQISLGVALETGKIVQKTLPFKEGGIGIVFSDGLLKQRGGAISPDAFLRKAAEYLREPGATLSSVGQKLMSEMNGRDDGWLCLLAR